MHVLSDSLCSGSSSSFIYRFTVLNAFLVRIQNLFWRNIFRKILSIIFPYVFYKAQLCPPYYQPASTKRFFKCIWDHIFFSLTFLLPIKTVRDCFLALGSTQFARWPRWMWYRMIPADVRECHADIVSSASLSGAALKNPTPVCRNLLASVFISTCREKLTFINTVEESQWSVVLSTTSWKTEVSFKAAYD